VRAGRELAGCWAPNASTPARVWVGGERRWVGRDVAGCWAPNASTPDRVWGGGERGWACQGVDQTRARRLAFGWEVRGEGGQGRGRDVSCAWKMGAGIDNESP